MTHTVIAFALPERATDVLMQSVARTLQGVGALVVLCLAVVLVFRFAQQQWLWYGLLAMLSVIVTWVVWLVSQAIPVTVLATAAVVTSAWLVTLGRNHLGAGPASNKGRRS